MYGQARRKPVPIRVKHAAIRGDPAEHSPLTLSKALGAALVPSKAEDGSPASPPPTPPLSNRQFMPKAAFVERLRQVHTSSDSSARFPPRAFGVYDSDISSLLRDDDEDIPDLPETPNLADRSVLSTLRLPSKLEDDRSNKEGELTGAITAMPNHETPESSCCEQSHAPLLPSETMNVTLPASTAIMSSERMSFSKRQSSTASSTYESDASWRHPEEEIKMGIFTNQLNAEMHEVAIRISVSADMQFKYHQSNEDDKAARALALEAFESMSFASLSLPSGKSGRIRIVSKFRSTKGAQVKGYLFENFVIMAESAAGAEDSVVALDLTKDTFRATSGFEDGRGILHLSDSVNGQSMYIGDEVTVAWWIVAIHKNQLNFPLHNGITSLSQLDFPSRLDVDEIEVILCITYGHLNILPRILGTLGPQDRVGLIVSAADGSCAWLASHKINWEGWERLYDLDFGAYSIFTPAHEPILETATKLFSNPSARQSILMISGCPVVSTSTNACVHVVGIGEYDIDLFSDIACRNGGQFYHANTFTELLDCVSGIVSSEKAVRHRNLKLRLEMEPGSHVGDVVGLENVTEVSPRVIEVKINRLLAGQSRTILFEVRGNANPGTKLMTAQLFTQQSEISSAVHVPHTMGASNAMFFDRLTRIAAEILEQGNVLAKEEKEGELLELLSRASSAINRAVDAVKMPSQGKYSLDISNYDENSSEAIVKAAFLAQGIEKLYQEVSSTPIIPFSCKAKLREAALILQNQLAVTRRTTLERIFSETLPVNVV